MKIVKNSIFKGLLAGIIVAVLCVTSIGAVYAATSLVASSSLSISHNSNAWGTDRSFSKKHQYSTYYWTYIDSGASGDTWLTVYLEKPTWFGLNHETVATAVVYPTSLYTTNTADFGNVGSGTYRLHHSTYRSWGASTGEFQANPVNIYTAD